ncbi:hypothetical protein LCGC14_0863020 [marine sediment metagenome]|uniref:Tyr recombinase domain-containing protein n=1 Tax=marine sediment metagenome TaxID=412755 RepID=A0A0F9P6U9_9ZZZZ
MDENNDIRKITRKGGRTYTVRSNRDRFWFPDEWIKFYNALKSFQKHTFNFQINTGARINELRHVKVEDMDLERKRITLRITKIKAKKKETTPRPRIIAVSSQFAKYMKKYIRDNSLNGEDYTRVLSTPAACICIKKVCKKVGIKDYYMFATHNIRKTHGNYLKALGVDAGEICSRLGHDYDTFLKSYASPDIFSSEEKQKIRDIVGDLYQRRF